MKWASFNNVYIAQPTAVPLQMPHCVFSAVNCLTGNPEMKWEEEMWCFEFEINNSVSVIVLKDQVGRIKGRNKRKLLLLFIHSFIIYHPISFCFIFSSIFLLSYRKLKCNIF